MRGEQAAVVAFQGDGLVQLDAGAREGIGHHGKDERPRP